MAELTPSAPETGATSPVSVGACEPSRVSASCSGCACCAPSEPNSIGSTHCKASPSTPKSRCIASIEPGALNTPPTQSSPGPKAVETSCRPGSSRSEEHTSELQSRRDLVCRLLLEKKKKKDMCTHVQKKKTERTR